MRFIPAIAATVLFTIPAIAAPLTSEQTRAVEALIEKTLTEKPELVVDAFKAYQEKQQAAENEQRNSAIADVNEKLKNDTSVPYAGNPNGSVTLVQFYDYNCGYCHKLAPTIMELEKEDKDLKVVFIDFPILGPSSITAAKMALAFNLQQPKKYADFFNAIMTAGRAIDEDLLLSTAKSLGADVDRLKRDADGEEVKARIDQNMKYANALQVRGTPAMLIGNEFVPGAVDKAHLEEIIAKKRQ